MPSSEAQRSTYSSLGTLPVPDATELELTAQELRDAHTESIFDTSFHPARATPIATPQLICKVFANLCAK